MAIDAVSGAANASALAGSRQTIADNFDTFLSLLTTQLKNQNPLDPLDTNQFTQQMVQFTGVEQQLKTNEFLEALVLSNQSKSYTDAVAFIGKKVTASGATTQLTDQGAVWSYNVSAYAPNVTVTVRDVNGQVVNEYDTALNAGPGQFQWDGTDAAGHSLPNGTYSITIDARNENGAVIPVSTETTGTVTAVDLSEAEPVLIVDGARIYLSTVTSVIG